MDMQHEPPCSTIIALYLVFVSVVGSGINYKSQLHTQNSIKHSHWKLDEQGKIIRGPISNPEFDYVKNVKDINFNENNNPPNVKYIHPADDVLSILTNRVISLDGSWVLTENNVDIPISNKIQPTKRSFTTNLETKAEPEDVYHQLKFQDSCFNDSCKHLSSNTKDPSFKTSRNSNSYKDKKKSNIKRTNVSPTNSLPQNTKSLNRTSLKTNKNQTKNILDCGKPVDFTRYDYLSCIKNRQNQPNLAEPEVSLNFIYFGLAAGADLSALEVYIKKLRKKDTSSALFYSQMGNYWRVRGNTLRSIECFRHALAIFPNHVDLLLYLAHLLLSISCPKDASVLAKISLDIQSSSKNFNRFKELDGARWLEHYTIAELLTMNSFQFEASEHLKHSFKLNPELSVAAKQLEVDDDINDPDDLMHFKDTDSTNYSLLIVIFLILVVLCGMLPLVVAEDEKDVSDDKDSSAMSTRCNQRRHFNRALAMRSMRTVANTKLVRARRHWNNE